MLMTQNFNRTISITPAPPAGALPSLDPAAVPEPGIFGGVIVALTGMLRRQRIR
jgi:hypothetical protein